MLFFFNLPCSCNIASSTFFFNIVFLLSTFFLWLLVLFPCDFFVNMKLTPWCGAQYHNEHLIQDMPKMKVVWVFTFCHPPPHTHNISPLGALQKNTSPVTLKFRNPIILTSSDCHHPVTTEAGFSLQPRFLYNFFCFFQISILYTQNNSCVCLFLKQV